MARPEGKRERERGRAISLHVNTIWQGIFNFVFKFDSHLPLRPLYDSRHRLFLGSSLCGLMWAWPKLVCLLPVYLTAFSLSLSLFPLRLRKIRTLKSINMRWRRDLMLGIIMELMYEKFATVIMFTIWVGNLARKHLLKLVWILVGLSKTPHALLHATWCSEIKWERRSKGMEKGTMVKFCCGGNKADFPAFYCCFYFYSIQRSVLRYFRDWTDRFR